MRIRLTAVTSFIDKLRETYLGTRFDRKKQIITNQTIDRFVSNIWRNATGSELEILEALSRAKNDNWFPPATITVDGIERSTSSLKIKAEVIPFKIDGFPNLVFKVFRRDLPNHELNKIGFPYAGRFEGHIETMIEIAKKFPTGLKEKKVDGFVLLQEDPLLGCIFQMMTVDLFYEVFEGSHYKEMALKVQPNFFEKRFDLLVLCLNELINQKVITKEGLIQSLKKYQSFQRDDRTNLGFPEIIYQLSKDGCNYLQRLIDIFSIQSPLQEGSDLISIAA